MPIFEFENYFYIIYAASFFSAIISASIGFIGGTVMLVVMAQFLRMEVLIPLHGMIQFISNSSRAYKLRQNINWKIGKESIIGALIGAVVGYFYLTPLPEKWFNLIIGLFIIFMTCVPKFRVNISWRGKWMLLGFISCSLGLFVGAIGILIGSFLLAENLEKKEMISTQATLQSVIHFTKIVLFALLGFSLTPWILLVSGAMLCAYFGMLVGVKILDKIPQKTFRFVVTSVVLILAARLVFMGFAEIF